MADHRRGLLRHLRDPAGRHPLVLGATSSQPGPPSSWDLHHLDEPERDGVAHLQEGAEAALDVEKEQGIGDLGERLGQVGRLLCGPKVTTIPPPGDVS